MGKRSDFKRIPLDLYPTPAKAVQPLVPYLRVAGIRSFAEPCCGNGDLVRHLEGYGLTCEYRGDIATGQDALTLTSADCNNAHCILTNPPYDTDNRRKLMHELILHFQRIAPVVCTVLQRCSEDSACWCMELPVQSVRRCSC
jgi:hypothetical protein